MMKSGISGTNTKRGLAPRSLIHFRMDEMSGTVTDSVNGATVANSANSLLSFGVVPNAVSNLGAGNNIDKLVNLIGFQADTFTTGTIIVYSCCKYLDIPAALDEADSGQREFHLYHYTPTLANFPIFVNEWKYPSQRTLVSFGSGTIAIDQAVTQTVSSGGDNNQLAADVDNLTGNLISFCAAIKIGVTHTPEVVYADGSEAIWNGNGVLGTDSIPPSTTTKILGWNNSLTNFTLAHGHGYVTGALHLNEHPTKAELAACAKWHYDNAPAGNKDVWAGWSNYK